MDKIFWTEELSVHVKILDDQHKKLIAFLNENYEKATKMSLPEEINDFFDRLTAHAHDHFVTEEEYFKRFDFEGSAEHI